LPRRIRENKREREMQLTTTLNRIQMCNPCSKGWKKLLKHLGKTVADDELLPFSVILDSNGLEDALWCCHTAPEYNRVWRLYAVWCARQVQYLMIDQRSLNALDVAERYANGQATDKELSAAGAAAKDAWIAARAAAGAAAKDAWIAGDIAREAALAAKAAALAAGVVAQAVAKNVAGIAVWAAQKTARDTKAAVWIAEDAAWETIQAAQAAKFRKMISDR